jgi:mono/diheme cytochrome c family protein
MTKLVVLITIIASLIIIAACTNNQATNTANTANTNATTGKSPVPSASTPMASNGDPSNELASGHDLYVKNCANCHKESGEGGPTVVDGRKMKPDNLTDDRRKKLSDDKYLKTMIEGVEDEGMPSFKDKLTEAQMRDIIKYIRVELQKQDAGSTSSAAVSSNASAAPSNK